MFINICIWVFLQLTAISESVRTCQFNAPMKISEIKHENVRCCLLPWRPWSIGLPASRWLLTVWFISASALLVCEYQSSISIYHDGLFIFSDLFSKNCSQSLFYISIWIYKMALFTFESYFGSSETSNSLISKFLSFLNVCPKVAFLDTPQIAFFAFKIHTGECILHLFGLYVPKLYFHFNLK